MNKQFLITAVAFVICNVSTQLCGQPSCGLLNVRPIESKTMAFVDLTHEFTLKTRLNIRSDAFTSLDNGLVVRNGANDNPDRSELDQDYALEVEGTVHIGDGYHFDNDDDNDSNPDGLDFGSAAAREDIRLFVEDGIATEELIYIFETDWTEWPDYVFEAQYPLLNLTSLETFIEAHHHLPNVPNQAQVRADGVSDKHMNMVLLEKVEELTLYTIQQDQELKESKTRNKFLFQQIDLLTARVNALSNNQE